MPVNQFAVNLNRYEIGLSTRRLSELYGVSQRRIQQIVAAFRKRNPDFAAEKLATVEERNRVLEHLDWTEEQLLEFWDGLEDA